MTAMKVLGIGLLSTIIVIGIAAAGMYISYSNQEIALRNTIKAKMTDNQSEFDNMWKKISQVAQVTEQDRESLKDIFNSYASARTGSDNGASLMRWVQESIPNVDRTTMVNLQNIITSSRDSFTMRQKELIDYKREHDNLIKMFPSSLFVGSRGEIEITVVTSNRTQQAFASGSDDSVAVFSR